MPSLARDKSAGSLTRVRVDPSYGQQYRNGTRNVQETGKFANRLINSRTSLGRVSNVSPYSNRSEIDSNNPSRISQAAAIFKSTLQRSLSKSGSS